MKPLRKEIGSFKVFTELGEEREVIVSQVVVTHYEKKHDYTGKFLTLGSIMGPQVARTHKDNVFRLNDSTELYRRTL